MKKLDINISSCTSLIHKIFLCENDYNDKKSKIYETISKTDEYTKPEVLATQLNESWTHQSFQILDFFNGGTH